MRHLSTLFPMLEEENRLYIHPGHFLNYGLCPEIDMILDIAGDVLGWPVDGLTGDEIILKLKARQEFDLVKELRTTISIYNASRNGV